MPRKAMRDVIVLLPGITGSVLQKDGKDVWAVSGGSVLNAVLSLGDDIRELALTEDPPDVDDLGDGYTKVVNRIKTTFDVTPGENFFEFPYDWRRDNRVAARKLAREGRAWLKDWRVRSGNEDAKLILVGHSMGGIVSRYFLECRRG